MADIIEVTPRIIQISKQVLEIRAVVKGKFYMRRYIGIPKKETMKMFENWLSDQL